MESIRNILIIEDNLSFAVELEMHLANWGLENVTNIDNSADALEFILTQSPDLILMDINIKGNLNGVEVAQQIADLDIPIIYMTGQRDEDFYENAKSTNVVSYLIKPFDELTLKGAIEFGLPQKTVEVVKSANKEDLEFFFIRKRGGLIKVNISEIDFIAAEANYCDIFCRNAKNTVKISLRQLLKQLKDPDLFQIHKGHAVRLNRIDEILLGKSEVRIGKFRIPIGRTYRADFLDRMKII